MVMLLGRWEGGQSKPERGVVVGELNFPPIRFADRSRQSGKVDLTAGAFMPTVVMFININFDT